MELLRSMEGHTKVLMEMTTDMKDIRTDLKEIKAMIISRWWPTGTNNVGKGESCYKSMVKKELIVDIHKVITDEEPIVDGKVDIDEANGVELNSLSEAAENDSYGYKEIVIDHVLRTSEELNKLEIEKEHQDQLMNALDKDYEVGVNGEVAENWSVYSIHLENEDKRLLKATLNQMLKTTNEVLTPEKVLICGEFGGNVVDTKGLVWLWKCHGVTLNHSLIIERFNQLLGLSLPPAEPPPNGWYVANNRSWNFKFKDNYEGFETFDNFCRVVEHDELGVLANASWLLKDTKSVSIIESKNVRFWHDPGIGVHKTDWVNNLGTVARCGTKEFIRTIVDGSDFSMCGQIDVGFYSTYLVAEKVVVTTKHKADVYVWETNVGKHVSKRTLHVYKRTSFDLFNNKKKPNIQLYVHHVFIMDNSEELIIGYLSSVKDIVDSEDLSLNISYEKLQQNKIIKVIHNYLVKMCTELSFEIVENKEGYDKFYEFFYKNLKFGIHEYSMDKNKMALLVEFRKISPKMEALYTNIAMASQLIKHIKNMSIIELKNVRFLYDPGIDIISVHVTKPKITESMRWDWVLYMIDSIDEHDVDQLKEFKSKKLVFANIKGLKLKEIEVGYVHLTKTVGSQPWIKCREMRLPPPDSSSKWLNIFLVLKILKKKRRKLKEVGINGWRIWLDCKHGKDYNITSYSF